MRCLGCNTALDSRATFCPTCGRTVPDPFVGAVIAGRYQVERRIAIGTFGSVYRATQLDIDRDVALKIMHRELAADTNLVARFRREGEILLELRDRHTVTTYEVGETPDGLPFIAMELLAGESLLRLFHLHGVMPWPRMLGIARQMCSALGEAHARGVVHRDLKPGNIFVTTDEQVKILEFGIAKIMSNSELGNPQELTVMGTAVGTLEYMAPEQLMGGKADGRTDIYTLGVLCYEMICGRRPFNAAGLDLLTVQLTEEPPPISQTIAVPRAVDELVARCLSHDSDVRFANVDELARALDSVLAAAPRRAPSSPVALSSAAAQPRIAHPVGLASAPELVTEQVAKRGRVPFAAIAFVLAALAAAIAAVFVLTGCGDNVRACEPDATFELPRTGHFIDPQALPLPAACVLGGLVDLPGRWFVVDPTQYFRYEYPLYQGTCAEGFRRSFTSDDHVLDDGSTFYTWSDGTRYFQRSEQVFDKATNVRAFAACMLPDGTLAAVYGLYDTDHGERLATATGTRFAPHDELASGLELLGELGHDIAGTQLDALNLVVRGGYAYVAGFTGLDVIDVADPRAPRAVGHYDGAFNDVKVVDDGTHVVAYLSPRASTELTSVVDVTDPTAPRFVQFLMQYSHSLFVLDRSLYLATYNESVPRYDVTNALAPFPQGMAIVPGEVSGVHDLFVAGQRIYANNTQAGLNVFDVSADLSTATELGRDVEGYSHASWAGTAGGRPVILHGDEGMTRTPDGAAHLRILDGDPASPTFMRLLANYQTRREVGIHNFELHGDRAYIAYYQDGVRIVDLANPAQPVEVAHYNTWDPETAFGGGFEGALGIRLVDGLIYVADDLRGLLIFAER